MKTIPLSKGYEVLVSDEDYDYLNQYKWHANIRRYNIYARRELGKRRTITIAKEAIIRIKIKGIKQISYKDGNSLNCQRNNLISAKQNIKQGQNKNLNKNNTSGYMGVSWQKDVEKYTARICINRVRIYLGLYEDEKEAAKAYDEVAKEYYGEKAILNFPECL